MISKFKNKITQCDCLDVLLIRLITPPNGIVLDPFAGSGSTCVAAKREGFDYIGIEITPEYVEIAKARTGEAV